MCRGGTAGVLIMSGVDSGSMYIFVPPYVLYHRKLRVRSVWLLWDEAYRFW